MVQSAAADAATLRMVGYRYTGPAQTAIDFIQNSGTNFQSQIALSTDTGAGITERMRIAANGTISLGAAPGAESLRVTPVASAVNYLNVVGRVAGQSPYLQSAGSDANVGMEFFTKGTGSYLFYTNSGSPQFLIAHTASAVNYLSVTGGAANGDGQFSAQGSDANIGITYSAKGARGHFFTTSSGAGQFYIAPTASAVNYISVFGGPTGSGGYFQAAGSDTNIPLVYSSKGNREHAFYTDGNSFIKQFQIAHTASAVNYFSASGGTTGNGASLTAGGSDTNIDAGFFSKGTGSHNFWTGGLTKQFQIVHTASAVNYIQVTGNGAGTNPNFTAQGSDANVGIFHTSKGSGSHAFYSNSFGALQFNVSHTASTVNWLNATGSPTGNAVTLSAQGSDTNIDLTLTPKGTGVLKFGTYTAGVVAQAGYITIKDAGGTTRRLLVG